jgi:hypothetical protein
MSEAGSVRRRRSRVEVEKLVAEYEASGLTRDVFCQQWGLSVVTLDKYRRRVQKWARAGSGPMLPVEVVLSTAHGSNFATRGDGGLMVESRGGHRIEVSRRFDAETLERLLKILDKV